jgi:hypothetical protein
VLNNYDHVKGTTVAIPTAIAVIRLVAREVAMRKGKRKFDFKWSLLFFRPSAYRFMEMPHFLVR